MKLLAIATYGGLMKNLYIFKGAITLLALCVAGCAMQGGTPSAAPPLSSATQRQTSPVTPMHAPGKPGPLAGKYDGWIMWSKGTQMYSGVLGVRLRFHKMNALTAFNITANGQTVKYRFGGWCSSKGSGQAQMVFILYNPKGGYVTGSASIMNGTFSGHGKSPAGVYPPVWLNFSTTKQQ